MSTYLDAARAILRGLPEPATMPTAGPPRVSEALPGKVEPTHWPVTDAELLAMPLQDFATAGLVVRVWSSVLGERVIFASDNARLDPGERLPVYRASELRELLGLGAGELRQVHEVKKAFAGKVETN